MKKVHDAFLMLYIVIVPVAVLSYLFHSCDFWSGGFFLPFSTAWKAVWVNGNLWDNVLQILVLIEYVKIVPYFAWLWITEIRSK